MDSTHSLIKHTHTYTYSGGISTQKIKWAISRELISQPVSLWRSRWGPKHHPCLPEMIHGLRLHASLTLPTPTFDRDKGKGPCTHLLRTLAIPIHPREAEWWHFTFSHGGWRGVRWNDMHSGLYACIRERRRGSFSCELCPTVVYAYECVSVCMRWLKAVRPRWSRL